MSSSIGVAYVAYGKNYAYQCAFSARSVRSVCDIPIIVFMNVPPHEAWDGIDNVTMVSTLELDKRNRGIKTSLIEYSPFDKTLYLDTDTAVRSADFLRGFTILDAFDIAAVSVNESIPSAAGLGPVVYREAHGRLGYRFPVTLVNGGVMFFRKSEAARKVFTLWNLAWDGLGCGRDMPALAWALQNVPDLKLKLMEVRWNCPTKSSRAIISHAWGKNVLPGIPQIVKLKPSVSDPEHRWVRTGAGVNL